MSGPRSYSTSPISGGARYGSGARKTGQPGSESSGWPTTGSRNRESFIRGQRVASPLDTQGGSRMPELGPYGSVRGARGNSRPYRENWLFQSLVTSKGGRILKANGCSIAFDDANGMWALKTLEAFGRSG